MSRSLRASSIAVAALGLLAAQAGAQQKTVTGSFGPSSPTWNRVFTIGVTDADVSGCAYPAYDSQNDGQAYAVFTVAVTQPERLLATVVEEGTTLDDTVLLLYCEPFDPTHPEQNLVIHNNGFGDPASFEDSAAIDLLPGTTYALVLTTDMAGDFGTYEIALTSPTAYFVTPEPSPTIAAGLAAAILGGAHRRRRRLG